MARAATPAPAPSVPPDPAILHVTEDTRTYPCPSCGGVLVFAPATQDLACQSCGNRLALPPALSRPAAVAKRDLAQAMAELQATVGQRPTTLEREVVCQSCGGHTVFSGTFTATRCPYCNTPIQRDDVQVAPTRLPVDGIIPLQVPENVARDAIERWINGRWFAPNDFKRYRELGSFSSIYLDYFAYDASTTTQYTGMRGVTQSRTVQDGEGRSHTEFYTEWYPAWGTVSNSFADVTGLANTGLDLAKVQALEPWPTELGRPYSPEFVAGHLSRTYDLDPAQVFDGEVRPRMEGVIEQTVRADIGGNEQRINSMDVEWLAVAFDQLALPVWMLTVTYKQRPFSVFINGVTGEVQGQRPYSAAKIALAVIAGVVLVVVIVLLVQLFGGN